MDKGTERGEARGKRPRDTSALSGRPVGHGIKTESEGDTGSSFWISLDDAVRDPEDGATRTLHWKPN